jgi:hypothetical protein
MVYSTRNALSDVYRATVFGLIIMYYRYKLVVDIRVLLTVHTQIISMTNTKIRLSRYCTYHDMELRQTTHTTEPRKPGRRCMLFKIR